MKSNGDAPANNRSKVRGETGRGSVFAEIDKLQTEVATRQQIKCKTFLGSILLKFSSIMPLHKYPRAVFGRELILLLRFSLAPARHSADTDF
jgi:hypothetical protein